jgi:hypothetical protein
MGSLGEIQECISGFAYLAVGVRLYLLSRRTNRLPERLLGLSFVIWSGNYLLYDIPYLFLEESTALPFYFAARLALDLGMILFAMFIWKVFRSQDRWGGWLVAGIGILLVAGLGGSVWVGDWEGMSPISNPWFWPAWLAGLISYAWMIAEGLLQYRRSRQRQRVGLCSALNCDRFRLWAVAGGIWVLVQWITIYQYIEYEATQEWGVFMGTLVGFLEIIPVVAIWFAFYPPAFYRNWVERRYAAA